jgi:hypothetical protein
MATASASLSAVVTPVASHADTESFAGQLLARAELCIENYLDLNPTSLGLLDDSTLVIEDELGVLQYAQGDLSFLMPSKPVLNKPFAEQLNPDDSAEYAAFHADVWDVTLPDDAKFVSKNGRKAVMFPIYTMKERFTGAVFLRATA